MYVPCKGTEAIEKIAVLQFTLGLQCAFTVLLPQDSKGPPEYSEYDPQCYEVIYIFFITLSENVFL